MPPVSGRHEDHAGRAGADWCAVVPVKPLLQAKSRLGVLGDAARRALALAFAEDVVRACTGCAAVRLTLVVTDDALAAEGLRRLGAAIVPDAPHAGLDAALLHGEARARLAAPDAGVVAVAGDLPALTSDLLGEVLAVARRRTVVPDADGAGTALLLAPPGTTLAPSYGGSSARRHARAGTDVLLGPPAARRDVDTPDDLDAAVRLGVGPSTAAVLGRLGLPDGPPGAVHLRGAQC
jgi:2-phospho-L-lactate guanylyltransferase